MSKSSPIAEAEAAIARGDVRTAMVSMLRADLAADGAETIRGELVQAQVLLLTGYPAEAARRSRTALAQARARQDVDVEFEALLVHAQARAFQRVDADVMALLDRALRLTSPGAVGWGRVRVRQGAQDVQERRMPLAEVRLQEAVELFAGLGEDEHLAHARSQLANAYLRQGKLEDAEAALVGCSAVYGGGPARASQASWHTLTAQRAWLHGDHEAADRSLVAALDIYGTLGMLPHQADCAVNRAEVLRSAGQLEEARELYLSLVAMGPGDDTRFFARLNLAVVELELGRPDEAADRADQILDDQQTGRGWVDGLLQVLVLPKRLTKGGEAWLSLRAARSLLEGAGVIYDPDVLRVLRGVGRVLEARGAVELGARVRGMALDHALSMGSSEQDVARERTALERLREAGARAWLGNVQLDEVIGSGGMGTVWRGTEPRTGRVLAVKVIRGDAKDPAASERASASLQRELRQVAALSHPGIVDVLDAGEVSASAEACSGGALLAGSPYVVMALVDGGTLADLRGTLDWPTVRGVLMVLLDALAHAHARGLVHLDLKPANVLVAWDAPEQIQGIRLADFGISRGFRDAADATLHAGTPRYMAPEQFQGQWRLLGPWTDLYALGCLTTALLTGRPPFVGSTERLRDAHLHAPPPPLRPHCAVPEGLEAWVQRLLQKHPLDRFLRAADAAIALTALDGAPLVDGSGAVREQVLALGAADTWVLDAVQGEDVPQETPMDVAAIPVPVCPASPPRARPPRSDGGVAMLAQRSPRVIGRERAEQELWRWLHEAHTRRRVFWVEIVAPPGLRAEALCRWLAFRAHEVGVASPVFWAQGVELAEALCGHLGLSGLEGPALRRQLAARARAWRLDGQQLEALASSIEEGRVGAEAEAWLRAATRERPVVWVAGEPTPEQRRLVSHLEGAGFPLLVVSYRDPLGPVPEVAAARRLSLEAIDDVVMFEGLVEPFVEPSLRWELAERAEGCEDVVRRLIAHHVDRGNLVEGADGLARHPTARGELTLPPQELWLARVARWRREVSGEVWKALERICVVPEPVPCRRVGAEADELLERGWVRSSGEGLLPRVADVRRAVRTAMLREGRMKGVALALAKEGGWSAHGAGAMWLWAGDIESAEASFRVAVADRLAMGQPLAARVVARRWERAARQLGLSDDDPRREEGQRLLSWAWSL